MEVLPQMRGSGSSCCLSATMADGGSLYLLSGPGGTGFNGETARARTGGGPTEPSNC